MYIFLVHRKLEASLEGDEDVGGEHHGGGDGEVGDGGHPRAESSQNNHTPVYRTAAASNTSVPKPLISDDVCVFSPA